MYISNRAKTARVKNAVPRVTTCARCSNTTSQELLWWEDGAFFRFAGMHLAGRKGFGYVCGVCGAPSLVLSKAQAKALRG